MKQTILLGVIGLLVIGIGWVGYTQLMPQTPPAAEEVASTSVGTTTDTVTPSVNDTVVAPTIQTFTLAEIAMHASASDCYTAIHGAVYDLTSFVGRHPGGDDILKICGKDGTAIFTGQHGGSSKQADILVTLKVGVLGE